MLDARRAQTKRSAGDGLGKWVDIAEYRQRRSPTIEAEAVYL
jgi:hypothetical protein